MVSSLPFPLDFVPQDTGLTLCATVQLQQQPQKVVQVSDLVRFDADGSHQLVIFTVAASHFRHLFNITSDKAVIAATNYVETEGKGASHRKTVMWVAQGQCMDGVASQRGTWLVDDFDSVPMVA